MLLEDIGSKPRPTTRTEWNTIRHYQRCISTSTETPIHSTETSMSNIKKSKKALSTAQYEELLKTMKVRFEKNMNRHKGLEWEKVQAKLDVNQEKLRSLSEMERTGGEPDVVGYDSKTDEYIFYDCSAESPDGRRSVCYDREGLESRKEHKQLAGSIQKSSR